MIGESILKLLGNEDPRLALMAAMTGGAAPGAPQPTGGAPAPAAAGAPAGAPAQPQQPPQPAAYTSPPELVDLYSQLMDRQRKSSLIDRGIGMIGASLAHPENRASILNAYGGGGGGSANSDPMSMIKGVMDFQSQQSALAQKAAHRAALPSIAAQYGLDLQTAQYLFDSGQLDKTLHELSKPNKQLISGQDGRSYIVDLNSGSISDGLGPEKQRGVELVDDGRGGKIAVYADTKEPVGANNIPGMGPTEDVKTATAINEDRVARGLEPLPLEGIVRGSNRDRAGAANLGPNGVDYGSPPTDMAWQRDEEGNIAVDPNGSPIAVPIVGSKLWQAQQDAEKKAGERESTSNTQAQFMDVKVKDVLDSLDQYSDSWSTPTVGSIASATSKYLPGTVARKISSDLTTLKANLGFEKLQAMRDASPSGGALGQVSDFENKLLQSTFGDLDDGLDPQTLIRNLYRVNTLTRRIVFQGIKDNTDAEAALQEADAAAAAHWQRMQGGGEQKPTPVPSDNIQDILDKYK